MRISPRTAFSLIKWAFRAYTLKRILSKVLGGLIPDLLSFKRTLNEIRDEIEKVCEEKK